MKPYLFCVFLFFMGCKCKDLNKKTLQPTKIQVFNLNNCKEINFTSEPKFPPQHSTSCILGIPRKSRANIPEKKTRSSSQTIGTCNNNDAI